MARVAFVNTGKYSSSRGISSFSDPIHLVAMHNLCKQAGHESRIFQLGASSIPASIAAIKDYNPNVLGLSFLAPFKNDLLNVDRLLSEFRFQDVHLLLGGPDIQFDPEFYLEKFSGERADEWRSCTLVDGPGEYLIQTLVKHDFDIASEHVQSELKGRGTKWDIREGIHWIRGLREMPLDEQDHSRDYDLAPFELKAGVKWATGCWAACSFCPNIPGKSAYKSSSLIAEEVEALRRHGAEKLDIASPQFTAHPKLASQLLGALPEDSLPVFFSSRVDSLFHAVTRFPEEWKRFANSNFHGIGLGVDSFLPEKLMRLRKYNSIAQARQQQERLDTVLSFFSDTKLNVVFYMITFDWEMELEEVGQELESLLDVMNRFSSTVQIAPENVTNVLSANRGSEFSRTRKPIDFLRFEREPRLFLMLYTMYATHELMEELINQTTESQELLEAAASRALVKFGLRFLEVLNKHAKDGVDFRRSFEVLQTTLGTLFQEGVHNYASKPVQQQLLSVYPEKPQKKIRKFLEKEEKRMKKTLEKEFDILLTRKALHRMWLEGRMDEKTYRKKLQKYQ